MEAEDMERRSLRVVRFLGWHGYDTPLICGDGFDASGIALDTDYVWEDQTIVDRLTASTAGRFDVVSPDLKFVPRMVAAGLCAEIDLDLIPNHRDLLPMVAEQPGLRSGEKQYAIPFTWGAHPMVYRPDLVVEPPTSWLDALRAEYRGKVVMVGDYGGNLAAWAPVVTGTTDPGRLTREELKATIDFLIKIKREHACAFTTDYVEMVDIMGRAEAVISTLGWEPPRENRSRRQ
jgi:spermidine/putrescine-binding protein